MAFAPREDPQLSLVLAAHARHLPADGRGGARVFRSRREYVLLQDFSAAWEASFRARKINLLAAAIMGIAAAVYLLSMAVLMLVVK